ncbi:hypothetical protein SCA03_10590 [Streptomyces cacaoi]|uniref:Uncharacterized protein n=1 Tax=Streptomyces cacaoi TaxID=1898 RepID=A0A4Y3QVQ8_STRCI|nr:hypothetical protein SCA03_10590 [Streptomyces cacaoi]
MEGDGRGQPAYATSHDEHLHRRASRVVVDCRGRDGPRRTWADLDNLHHTAVTSTNAPEKTHRQCSTLTP